jgi:hypothetical protein
MMQRFDRDAGELCELMDLIEPAQIIPSTICSALTQGQGQAQSWKIPENLRQRLLIRQTRVTKVEKCPSNLKNPLTLTLRYP